MARRAARLEEAGVPIGRERPLAIWPVFAWRLCRWCGELWRREWGWEMQVGPFHGTQGHWEYCCAECAPTRHRAWEILGPNYRKPPPPPPPQGGSALTRPLADGNADVPAMILAQVRAALRCPDGVDIVTWANAVRVELAERLPTLPDPTVIAPRLY